MSFKCSKVEVGDKVSVEFLDDYSDLEQQKGVVGREINIS